MKLTADGFIIRETKTTKTIAEYGGGFGLSVNVIGVTLSWATANGETIYQFSPQTFEIKSQANTTTISARNAVEGGMQGTRGQQPSPDQV
jgi:hypothetical protein